MNTDTMEVILEQVEGWLTIPEAKWLMNTAAILPTGSTIIEIGAYRGRSTIALACGARMSSSVVYSIDPHHYHMVGEYEFSPKDGVKLMSNILMAGVADLVRIINLPSDLVPTFPGNLVFIDGDHEYNKVSRDFSRFGYKVSPGGIVAIHDTAGRWPGPTRVFEEASRGKWRKVETIDSLGILEKI